MKLALRERNAPLIEFRKSLPDWLSGGDDCYIEIDARPAGAVNPEYMAGLEQIALSTRVRDMKNAEIEDPDQKVKSEHEDAKFVVRSRMGLLYDACVIEWRSNIIDNDAPIKCDKEHFLALAELRGVPEITGAIVSFEAECLRVGREIGKMDDETEKK